MSSSTGDSGGGCDGGNGSQIWQTAGGDGGDGSQIWQTTGGDGKGGGDVTGDGEGGGDVTGDGTTNVSVAFAPSVIVPV